MVGDRHGDDRGLWRCVSGHGRGSTDCGDADAHGNWVIGVFTATVVSFFFENEQQSETDQLAARLDRIEQKLDELLTK